MLTLLMICLFALSAAFISWSREGADWDAEFERAYLFDGIADQ